jgi:dTDP-4-dehydrorhamnose reductase
VSTSPATRDRRPILLFGATGQVGRELMPALAPLSPVVAPGRADADLTRPETLRDVIRRVRPIAIVNAAALTNVDHAEREPDLARAVNEIAPSVMAEEARRVGATLVHYSTDYVFDGRSTVPYDETAEPNPINVYGASKLAGERSIAAADAPHLVIRTSWVYSLNGNGFVPTLLRQLADSRPVRVVSDQVGSPTWSRSLALATAAIVRLTIDSSGGDLPREDWGIYHLGGSGAASRLEIAHEVMGVLGESTGKRLPVVIPISAAEFNAVAERPRFSALSNARTGRRFGISLDGWQREVRRMLDASSS